MMIQQNIAQSFQSPVVRVLLGAIAIALLYVLWKEVRKIPAKLFTLMATAFVDMVGLLMIIPLLPFYVKELGGSGIDLLGLHFGIGSISGFIIASFTIAQLLSAPMWGRFSDRVGRRPTLLIAIGAAGIAYLIFGFAHSLLVLFLSRLVQGAGGGTVGVIQAYVADSTDPKDRARALGWLSATTNLGVALGPVLGSFAIALGKRDLMPGPGTLQMGRAGPGILAAALCVLNMIFAARYLTESRDLHRAAAGRIQTSDLASGDLARNLAFERALVASHLDLCDLDRRLPGKLFGARAFSERALSGHRTDDWLFLHVRRRHLGFRPSAAVGSRGRLARRGESLPSGPRAVGRGRSRYALVAELVDAGARRRVDPARHSLHVPVRDCAVVESDCSRRTRLVYGNATDVWRSRSHHRAAVLRLGV